VRSPSALPCATNNWSQSFHRKEEEEMKYQTTQFVGTNICPKGMREKEGQKKKDRKQQNE
jgi:hypothetical protein